MTLLVLVNDVAEQKATMASWLLSWRAMRRGTRALLCGVRELSWTDDGLRALAAPVRGGDDSGRALAATKSGRRETVLLEAGDVLLLRTNPARDPDRAGHHLAAFGMARLALRSGVIVLNEPDAIERVGHKLFLAELPDHVRPRQLVTSRWPELLAFAQDEDAPVVIKPLYGTRGDGVAKVDVRSQGRERLLDMASELLSQGPVVVQEYLPAALRGDTRVLMLEGRALVVDGRKAAVRRVPQAGEFRSNVHLGASAAAGEWTEEIAMAVEAVGPVLRKAGVFLAGLDVVGDKVVEVNAYAPGGFGDAEAFEGVDFLGAVLDCVEDYVAKRRAMLRHAAGEALDSSPFNPREHDP